MEISAKVCSNQDGQYALFILCKYALFILCVVLCVCAVLLFHNLNYSFTTFAFVLLFNSYSGHISPINMIMINHSCTKNA